LIETSLKNLEILKELHESPELLELAKVDLQEHERLLNEIEGNHEALKELFIEDSE